jgi:hypothetical protein
MSKGKEKDKIIETFSQAEEHSNKLFSLLDQLAIESGESVNMKDIIA